MYGSAHLTYLHGRRGKPARLRSSVDDVLRQGDFGVHSSVPEDVGVGQAHVEEVVLAGIRGEAEALRVKFVSSDDHVHVVSGEAG